MIEEYSYDAWGNRRDPLTWSSTTSIPGKIYRGYTCHEHLDEFNLINMNGRMYDPSISRFFSPDNFVQAPNLTQSLNRYSYCFNNPLSFTDPDGNNPVVIAMAIGMAFGGYMGYQIGEANGASGLGMAGYIVGGAVIGGISGYAGACIAANGGFLANTMGMLSSSYFNSAGMAALSGGMIQPSISFGFGSYNFGTNEFNKLGDKGNKWYQDFGYACGALANLPDVISLFGGGTEADLIVEKKDAISHSALVNEDEGINISVGPNKELGEGINMDALLGKENGLSGTIKELSRTMKGKVWENHANDGKGWKLTINNLNRKILTNMSDKICTGMENKTLMWNLLGKSCVGYTSKALFSVGVINLGGIHPYWLQLQMAIRQAGIYSNPYLYQIP